MCVLCQMVTPVRGRFESMPVSAAGDDLPDVDRASYSEATDVAGYITTAYSMSPGDMFAGAIGSGGDRDWVRVSLSAGTTYRISLEGSGAYPLADPYLRLYDSSGNLLGFDDDGGAGLNSQMTFTPTSGGTYYLGAAGYGDANTGGYSLSLVEAPSLPVYTNDQVATQLTTGYWESSGGSSRAFDVTPGDTITVTITALTSDGQFLATRALEAWSSVTGLVFSFVSSGGQITFSDADAGAYSRSSLSGSRIVSSSVNISTDWIVAYGSTIDSYSFQTYIHEIGHALGLGHSGNYNGSAEYGIDNNYLNDSWQASVMSYFSQTENTYVNASRAYIVAPMIADIIAIQSLYGTYSGSRTGDTTYGENSTAGGYLDALLSGTNPSALTVLDGGGVDTFDFRSQAANQTIDLRAEHYSDVLGLVGNLAIARGTVIENVLSGSGDDTLTGNEAANRLAGGGGSDVAVFQGEQGAAIVHRFDGQAVVSTAAGGVDLVTDVEALRFDDGNVALVDFKSNNIYDYLASYEDLVVAIGDNTRAAVDHYFNYGFGEGRILDRFDGWSYTASYDDLVVGFGYTADIASEHYVHFGRGEGRSLDAFDEWSYTASYADLIVGFGNSASPGARHYVEFGYREGRTIDAFDEFLYLASNPDLIASIGLDRAAATQHYVQAGFSAGRETSSFDAIQYLSNYADLQAAYGNDYSTAVEHFVAYGYAEGRTDNFLA